MNQRTKDTIARLRRLGHLMPAPMRPDSVEPKRTPSNAHHRATSEGTLTTGIARTGFRLVAALLLPALPATAQPTEHPETVAYHDPESTSYNWILQWHAASTVLDHDGSVKASLHIPALMRSALDRQLAWFSARYTDSDPLQGQTAGYLSSREYCAPPLGVADKRPPEIHGGDFSSVLLLSEVAVTATVSEVIPGFVGTGEPELLFALAHVEPLHDRSRSPTYFMAPVGQFVVNGRMFCGERLWNEVVPRAGDRVVVVGRWNQGIVRMGHSLTGALALTPSNGDPLTWRFMAVESGPPTLSGLRQRTDEAVKGGLFDLAAPLLLKASFSADRERFSESWWKHHQNGCRIRSAQRLDDGSWQLSQVCGSEERALVQ